MLRANTVIVISCNTDVSAGYSLWIYEAFPPSNASRYIYSGVSKLYYHMKKILHEYHFNTLNFMLPNFKRNKDIPWS